MTYGNDGEVRSTRGRRALVIDDSRATRSMLRRLLQTMGFDVAEAAHGEEGLEALEADGPFALALVDWNMPVMDGLTFVKALRGDRRFADVVVLMVSSESDPEKMARALIKGADDYVIKPLTADILEAKLEALDTWREGPHAPLSATGTAGDSV
jgi:two-component system chemotaxis response regulator CheY